MVSAECALYLPSVHQVTSSHSFSKMKWWSHWTLDIAALITILQDTGSGHNGHNGNTCSKNINTRHQGAAGSVYSVDSVDSASSIISHDHQPRDLQSCSLASVASDQSVDISVFSFCTINDRSRIFS